MKTFTTSRNLMGTLTANTTSANLSLGDQLINDNIRYLVQKFNLNERSKTDVTVASQQFYTLPYNYKRLIDVTITVGNYTWTPTEVTSRQQWDRLNMSSVPTSTMAQFYYIYNGTVGFWPKPSASGNTITYNYKIRTRDLSQADYTTGTITVTNGSATITGSGTTWIADMAGRWLQVTAPSGDNEWYQISAWTSTTSMTLVNAYNGTTVSGASYTIGEVSILPEEFQDLPITYAVRQYYSSRVKDQAIFEMYKNMYDERYNMMNNELGSKDDNMVIDTGEDYNIINPNISV